MEKLTFKECVESLANKVIILSNEDSKLAFAAFLEMVPFAKWGSIDWAKVGVKAEVNSIQDLKPNLNELMGKSIDTNIIIFWDDYLVPAIQTKLEYAIPFFDDITAVGFYTWIFNPISLYMIEFHDKCKIGSIECPEKKLLHIYNDFENYSKNFGKKDEDPGVTFDIIETGQRLINIAKKLLNDIQILESEEVFLNKQNLFQSAWRSDSKNPVSLVKWSILLTYAQHIEKLKKHCKGFLAYKRLIKSFTIKSAELH